MSSASFRFRYLLGLLAHAALALVGCTPLPAARADTVVLASCDAEPNFATATELKRWRRFPISVYIELGDLPEPLGALYRQGVLRGIGLWAEATAGRIGTFRLSASRDDADVTISLTAEELPDRAMGSTELTFTEDRIVRARVRLRRSPYERTPFLAHHIANTTAHEMGHALGIVDHSPFPEDKMWVAGNFGVENQGRDPLWLLTHRDINTLEQAYCR